MSNLTPEIEHNIAQSEIEGGVWLKDVPVGKSLEVQTKNTLYTISHQAEKEWWIQGHDRFCPVPTKCIISGSTWGGSMLKVGFIGRGMNMEFYVEGFPSLTTSQIQDVREVPSS
jgi:hypothetical protein